MLMKVHSYIATNGVFSDKVLQLQKTREKLDQAVEDRGGWNKVLYKAGQETRETQRQADGAEKQGDAGTSASPSEGGSAIRKRRVSSHESPEDMKDPYQLVDYSDEEIFELANAAVDLKEDLTSTGKHPVTFPDNLTYWNYIDYLLIPTLVYELEYPRTSTIRPLYVLEKTLATFGTFFVIYTITEHIIFPINEASKLQQSTADLHPVVTFISAALDFILPFMVNYLLIFYIIFECICNGFAELTRFADRGFYEDWWNAVTWDEFARKWNKPVHQVSEAALLLP